MSKKRNQFETGLGVYSLLIQMLMAFCLVAANATRLGISAADMTTFSGLFATFNAAYAISKMKSTASPANRITTKDARKALTAFLRTFVKKYFYDNNLATTTDISTAGLEARLVPHAPYDTPKDKVVLTSEPLSGHQIKSVFKSLATGLKGKPDGVMCVRIRYFLGANPPVNPNDWNLFVDAKKNPTYLTFLTGQAGTLIALSGCYVGTNGKEGPYGNIVNTAIG